MGLCKAGRGIKTLAATCVFVLVAGSAQAAFSANYGDFPADNVDYNDVTEKNNGSTALYGPPVDPVVGDMLTFATTGDFRAEAPFAGFPSSTTSGRLEFFLDGKGQSLQELVVVEGGDYGWTALTGSSSLVSATLNIRIFDKNQQTLLLSENVVFTDDLILAGSPAVFVDDWELTGTVDLSTLNVDEVFVVINNNLAAAVEGSSTTFIEKKNFKVTGSVVPEPGALALLALGSVMMVIRRRPAA